MLPREGDGYYADVQVAGRRLRLCCYYNLPHSHPKYFGWTASVLDLETGRYVACAQSAADRPEEGKNKALELARTAINAELRNEADWKEDPPEWSTRPS